MFNTAGPPDAGPQWTYFSDGSRVNNWSAWHEPPSGPAMRATHWQTPVPGTGPCPGHWPAASVPPAASRRSNSQERRRERAGMERMLRGVEAVEGPLPTKPSVPPAYATYSGSDDRNVGRSPVAGSHGASASDPSAGASASEWIPGVPSPETAADEPDLLKAARSSGHAQDLPAEGYALKPPCQGHGRL